MTIEYFDSDPDDALYNLARRYPGKLPALALRLGRQESVLRKQLSPSVFSHHLSPEDFLTLIELCAEANVPGAYQPLHAMCFRLEHIALRLPPADASVDAGELFQQVLLMLREEGALASNIQDALINDGKIDRAELAEIECHLEQCIGALATLREQVRAKHRKDFKA
jgi:hypothetical protein